MKTNEKQLVIQSVAGRIHHPTLSGSGHWVGYDGYGRICVGTGGITYNFKIGDYCMDIAGDHVEPGVSIKNANDKENLALHTFACIGNTAKVISGDAKGKIGYVTGKHGGVDHTMIYFDDETLDLLCVDDRIQIKAVGQGLKLQDYPNIFLMNIDPSFLKKMNIQQHDGYLEVPVVTKIPAFLMGSGLGSTTMMNGDYDIMTQDKVANHTYGIDQLRFGDLVLIEDHDTKNGPHYKKGAVSIGVIAHSNSFTSGHGPGVTIIMSATQEEIKPLIDPNANIANYLFK